MNLDDIRDTLNSAGLAQLADYTERLALPAIRIITEKTEEADIPIGASKIGGRPDLPRDASWPAHDGKPYGFLAQFDLARLTPLDVEGLLPRTGLLSFFYDFATASWGLEAEERGGWQVLHFDSEVASLARADWPANLSPLYRLPSHQPLFSRFTSLTEEAEQVVDVHLSDDQQKAYANVVDAMRATWKAEDFQDDEDSEDDDFEPLATRHQLLGHPVIVHWGGMPWECEYVAAGRPNPMFGELRYTPYEQWDEQSKVVMKRAYERWRLLFQLGNISGLPFPEGDEDEDDPIWRLSELCDLWARGGLMYFWIEKERLAQRDFSNVWLLAGSQL